MVRMVRAALCLGALAWTTSLAAQELSLTPDSEVGFRQFMQLAEAGGLGSDVSHANVAIAGDKVRVEIGRASCRERV